MWEDSTEVKFEQLPSIARDLHMLENQLEQMQPLNREVTNFKPRIDETFELGKSLDALIQSAETVVTNRRRSTQVASGNVARTERRVVEIQQTFQVSEGKQNRDLVKLSWLFMILIFGEKVLHIMLHVSTTCSEYCHLFSRFMMVCLFVCF